MGRFGRAGGRERLWQGIRPRRLLIADRAARPSTFATRENHELSSQHRGAKSLVILSPAEVFDARAASTSNDLAFPTGFMS